jgi:hypothetical protein
MDPITTAIIAALTAGVVSGTTEVGKNVIVDAYNALKAALQKKCGLDSDLVEAVEKLEKKPDSTGRKETLKEEVEAAQADQDPDILTAAQALLELLKAQPGGEQRVQQIATGNYIAQASHGGTASVQVNRPKDKE